MKVLPVLKGLGSKAKTTLALVGFGTTAYAASEVIQYKDVYATTSTKKGVKKILMLPFHRMEIVEQTKREISLSSLLSKVNDSDNKVIKVEIRELVNVIHAAAEDPEIVAIHGTFGDGSGFKCGGYAHAEEVRNAIRIFNESHRRHYEPRATSQIGSAKKGDKEDGAAAAPSCPRAPRKVSYAYADTFANPDQKGYFIASAFSQVHMQPRGDLNLFGVSMTNFFLADAFQKYGLVAHVFKHGQYKNAPNSFSERGYTMAHYENTKSFLDSMNGTIFSAIAQSRSLPVVFDKSVWMNIHNYGTMTAENAQEIKLLDHLPRINPISDLIHMNKTNDKKLADALRDKWFPILSNKFDANDHIALEKYSSNVQKRNKFRQRQVKLYDKFKTAASRSSAFEMLIGALGLGEQEMNQVLSKYTTDKIALIHISGSIGNKTAMSIKEALKEIKKDDTIKCLVLRVDSPGGGVTASETILEECKDVGKPVVCSFSNYAASGGYYVSAFSDKIFAQRLTLTGSIGVFCIRFDASEACRRHGINFDSVSAGKHAGTYSLITPLNHAMKVNLSRSMDRIYLHFKKLVADGRNMTMEEVEEIAQGRVFTGYEAKDKHLVDEFGGIDRAIGYAISNYTGGKVAEVEVFPKKKTFWNSFDSEIAMGYDDFVQLILGSVVQQNSKISGCNTVLCMDEASAIQTILEDASY